MAGVTGTADVAGLQPDQQPCRTINVLMTSFGGLGLPSTLSIPIEEDRPISELTSCISHRLHQTQTRLILTTTSNKQLDPRSNKNISSLLSDSHTNLLPLRLSVPLCGGKGGFGSQLRAAGGRMSSKRKRNQEENNGSNRNLDGRRMRTVTEAKNLAEYMIVKPDREQKEKEARRKHWEQIIETAEKQDSQASRGRLPSDWEPEKERSTRRTGDAVLGAWDSGRFEDRVFDESTTTAEIHLSKIDESHGKSTSAVMSPSHKAQPLFGFDEDEDSLSEGENGDDLNRVQEVID